MPSMAQRSSTSLTSPVTPRAPTISPDGSRISWPPPSRNSGSSASADRECMKGGLFLGLLQYLPRRSIERERPERLAMGDLETHERGAVLLLERLHPAAGVEHDRGQGVGLALPGRREGSRDDLVGLRQRDRAHSALPVAATSG